MTKENFDLENCTQFEVELNFYTVRSKDGKFLRAKKHGYNSLDTGKSWTDNISEAKIYAKPGPARSQCTWWAKNYPTFGIPDLVLITTGKCFIVNEESRVKKQTNKSKIASLSRSLRSANYRLEAHNAKVKFMRGDGNDNESIRLRKQVKELEASLEKLRSEG